jgi:hypothetical protein
MTDFRIVEQGDLVAQKEGTYTSFPSLAKDPQTGEILILYRRAVYDETDKRPAMKAHGLEGNLVLKRFLPQKKTFSTEQLLFSGKDYPPGLIDGNLTVFDQSILLFIRRYPDHPVVFYTSGEDLKTLAKPKPFVPHESLTLGAQWGRAVYLPKSGKLLQILYGAYQYDPTDTETKPLIRAALYQSLDQGKSWSFVSWVAPEYLAPDVTNNETTIVAANQSVFALMRTEGDPEGTLYLAESLDEGEKWSAPKPSGLFGQAPMFYTLPDGRILACFRGFLPDTPEKGGDFSLAFFNPQTGTFSQPFVVEQYHGNHYDGGYGDMIWVESLNQLLVAYYYSDTPTPRNPWLRYALLTLA